MADEVERVARGRRVAECDRIREAQFSERNRRDAYARAGFPKDRPQ